MEAREHPRDALRQFASTHKAEAWLLNVRATWIVGFLLLLTVLATARATPARMLGVGDTAAPFQLKDLAGSAVSLQSLLGNKAVLVVFSSIGCSPCEESAVALREASARYGERLEVLCVMLSDIGAIRRRTGESRNSREPILLVDSYVDNLYETADAYGVLGTPTAFLIGPDGKITWRHVGRISLSHVDGEMKEALES